MLLSIAIAIVPFLSIVWNISVLNAMNNFFNEIKPVSEEHAQLVLSYEYDHSMKE